jgi:hypothetical protein
LSSGEVGRKEEEKGEEKGRERESEREGEGGRDIYKGIYLYLSPRINHCNKTWVHTIQLKK